MSEVPLSVSLGKVSCRLGGAVGLSSLELSPSTNLIKINGGVDCNIGFGRTKLVASEKRKKHVHKCTHSI